MGGGRKFYVCDHHTLRRPNCVFENTLKTIFLYNTHLNLKFHLYAEYIIFVDLCNK